MLLLQDLKDHMRTGGLAVEYVKIMTDYDGRSKVRKLMQTRLSHFKWASAQLWA